MTRLVLILAVLASGLFVVSYAAPTPVAAQGCTVIDTVNAIQNVIATGSVATKAGHRYEYHVSGDVQESGSTRHDLFYFTTNDWASSGSDWLLVAGNYITGLRGAPSYPSYSSAHTYTVDAFGTGSPVSAFIHYGSGTISISIEVCEYPPDYAIPTCTIIDRMDVIADGGTHVLSSVTLTSGQPYTLFLVGQSSTNTLPTTSWDHLVDPYWQTSDGWAAQSAASGFVNIGNTTSSTLIDTTYQSDHIYEVDVTGGGLQIDAIAGFGYGARGGVAIYICDPSITPTPFSSPTPTPTITPTAYPAPYSHRICVLLLDRAEFRSGWTFAGGADFASSDPDRFLELPPGGSATLTLALSPTKQYGLSVLLRAAEVSATDNGTIILSIGTSAAYSIPVEAHTDLRGFTTEAINYDPDTSGGYTVKFSRPTSATGDVVVEYFCLQATSTDGNASSGTGSENDRCTTCQAPDWFGDLGGILNWLICQLKNLMTCYLAQFLIYIQGLLAKITGYALDIFIWMVDGFNATVAWINAAPGQILRFFGGTASNTITGASNAFHTSGIANGMNIVASGARDLPTMLYNTFNRLVGQAGNAIVEGGSLLAIILKLIVVAFSAIEFALFGLVPLLIGSLIIGFFQPSNITSLSMTCTNPSSYVYYPCLIFYALDNTVLAGPAGYLFPLVMGLWAIQTFTWALNRVKEEISG